MLKLLFILAFTLLAPGHTAPHHRIDSLGTSPKGQFVALEEYGYEAQNNSYFVSIRIMNVWKKEYVGKPIELKVPVSVNKDLQQTRQMAKELAQEVLKSFNIISG